MFYFVGMTVTDRDNAQEYDFAGANDLSYFQNRGGQKTLLIALEASCRRTETEV